ncbi:MAG: hypothetical protein ABI781_19565 [Burkholderiales bacterium]
MKTIAAIVLAGLLGAASADETPIQVKRVTEPGREVLIRGFAEFNGNCTLRHVQTIRVVTPPANGRIETRPGEVTIGPNWVGNASCEGTKLPGVRVFYVPNEGFVGADRAVLEIGYQSNRRVRAEVDVTVRGK